MFASMSAQKAHNFDLLAIAFSGICLVQCLLAPVLLVSLPGLLGEIWVDTHFHRWLAVLAIPTSLYALRSGTRRHRHYWLWWPAGAALMVMSVAALMGPQGLGHDLEQWLTLGSGVVLAAIHVVNFRELRRYQRCQGACS